MHRCCGTAWAITLALAAGAAAQPPDLPPRAEPAVAAAFDVAEARTAGLDLPGTAGRPIVSLVPIDDEWMTLVLEPASVRAPGYRLLLEQADGSMRDIAPSPERTYRGAVVERPGSVVTATLLHDGLHGRIVLGPDEYWVQPLRSRFANAPDGQHVVYHTADVVPGDGVCAAVAPDEDVVLPVDEPATMQSSTESTLCVTELAIDVDSEYLAAYGSVEAVEDRVNAVVNAVNVQFERDAGITHEITTIVVRSAESDPYTTTDPGDLLTAFRTKWQDDHGDVPRDVAHLFTGKDLDGSVVGIAYVAVICSSAAYGLSQVDCCGSLACASDLVAHELGHNWSASHCDCSGYTMNPSLGCGNEFHPVSTAPDLIDFRDGRSCLACASDPPAVCGEADSGDCFVDNGTPHCEDADCCSTVCAVDATCCDVVWDQACADLAADLCVDPTPDPVTLEPTAIQVQRGEFLGGTLASLVSSDNDRLRVRSELAGGRYRVDDRITFSGAPETVAALNLTVEIGVNIDGMAVLIYLRNFDTNAWDRIDRHVLSTSVDEELVYEAIASPASYVNANGKVKLRVMTKSPTDVHVTRVDRAQVVVTP